jgi:hypothetical protein
MNLFIIVGVELFRNYSESPTSEVTWTGKERKPNQAESEGKKKRKTKVNPPTAHVVIPPSVVCGN